VTLEVRGIRRSFGPRTALDGVDFVVRPGVLTGLLGPNGAGKTTLLRVLLGVIDPDEGSVLVGGSPIGTLDRRSWGYMPQERGLYPAMAAGEQVVHFARLHGLPRREAEIRSRALLVELGLGDRWDDRTEALSGGMRQRLQLATALVHDPDVIVLDEPFAGLDPVAVAELCGTLRRRAVAGATVLFSSHQLDLVQDLCETIVMVHEGRVVLDGSVAELRAGSDRRRLRVVVDADDRWLAAAGAGLRVVSRDADGIRLEVPTGVDPLTVLDAARATGRVSDFGLELPSLSELFLEAVEGAAGR
jgi:ABC-2 type transport system ATP-binding protein